MNKSPLLVIVPHPDLIEAARALFPIPDLLVVSQGYLLTGYRWERVAILRHPQWPFDPRFTDWVNDVIRVGMTPAPLNTPGRILRIDGAFEEAGSWLN